MPPSGGLEQVQGLVYHPEAGSYVQTLGHDIARLDFEGCYEGTLPLQGGQRRCQQVAANTLVLRGRSDGQAINQLHRAAGSEGPGQNDTGEPALLVFPCPAAWQGHYARHPLR